LRYPSQARIEDIKITFRNTDEAILFNKKQGQNTKEGGTEVQKKKKKFTVSNVARVRIPVLRRWNKES